MFILTIDTENDAFKVDPGLYPNPDRPMLNEIVRILHALAEKLDAAHPDTAGKVRDINGNTVGRFDCDGPDVAGALRGLCRAYHGAGNTKDQRAAWAVARAVIASLPAE